MATVIDEQLSPPPLLPPDMSPSASPSPKLRFDMESNFTQSQSSIVNEFQLKGQDMQPVSHALNLMEPGFPLCVRCEEPITSGHAYELGDDKWHTHCFACYRCDKPLDCDSDFLVLGTGALICFDCSDSCKNCGKKIDDLAIILASSNEAYCSDCFKCCKCGESIKDLKYARTKKGLFCLGCHEKLLAKKKLYHEMRKLKSKRDKELPEIPVVSASASGTDNNRLGLKGSDSSFSVDSPVDLGKPEDGSRESDITGHSIEKPLEAVRRTPPSHMRFRESSNGTSTNNTHRTESNNSTRTTVSSKKTLLDKTPLRNNADVTDSSTFSPSSTRIVSESRRDGSELTTPLANKGIEVSKSDSFLDLLLKSDFTEKDMKGTTDVTSVPQISRQTPVDWKSDNSSKTEQHFSKGNEIIVPSPSPFYVPKHLAVETTQQHLQTKGSHSRESYYGSSTIPENEESKVYLDLERRIRSAKLTLKNLEDEIQRLREVKKGLVRDVNLVKSQKLILMREVDNLRHERANLQLQPPEQARAQSQRNAQMSPVVRSSTNIFKDPFRSPTAVPSETYGVFNNNNSNSTPANSGRRPSVISITRPVGKPKFWKFFSSSSQNSGPGSPRANSRNLPSFDSRLEPTLSPNVLDPASIGSIHVDDGSQLYGSTLVQRCSYEGTSIPSILRKCISYIESDEEHLRTEGIYRKSGSQLQIEQVEQEFSDGGPVDLSRYDVHVTTSVLKRYLRRLPDPVITYKVYGPLINLVRSRGMVQQCPLGKSGSHPDREDLDAVAGVLSGLPEEHKRLLRAISKHIDVVVHYKEDNLMNIHNLALVFAPGLIRDQSGEKDIVDMKERNYITGFIFEHYKQILHL